MTEFFCSYVVEQSRSRSVRHGKTLGKITQGSANLTVRVFEYLVIVDIVETGSTLKENGLKVLEEVCPLSARMVVNQVSMKMENERIRKLIEDLRRVLQEEM